MMKHVVVYRLKEEAEGKTKQENLEYIKHMLLDLVPMIPEIQGMEVGFDILSTASSYDMALLCDFADLESLGRYKEHAMHVRVSAYIHKVIEERISVDYEA